MSKIGNLIRTLRINQGMTQADLAKKLDITDKAVGKWEQGLGDPDLSLIKPIAALFNITTDEVLNGELNEVQTDITKSIYEKIVSSGIGKLDFFLSQGITILGKDEYNKTIIDYIYQYQHIDFLAYAIAQGWLKTVKFQLTERKSRNAYLGDQYIQHMGQLYVSQNTFEQMKQSYPNLRSTYDKAEPVIRLSDSSGLTHPFITSKVSFEQDLVQTLSVIVSNEHLALLSSFGYYRCFLTKDRVEVIFKNYVTKTQFDDAFFNELIVKNADVLLDTLLMQAVLVDNKVFIEKLLPLYLKNRPRYNTDYLNTLIKYNHPSINKTILLDEIQFEKLDIKTVYQHNSEVFKRLPESFIQQEYKHLSGLIDPNDVKDNQPLFLDPMVLIQNQKLDLLKRHLETVTETNRKIEIFVDGLIEDSKRLKESFKMSPESIKTFNQYFSVYFDYQRASTITMDEAGAILRPERQKQEQDFQDSMKDHRRLENAILKEVSPTHIKQSIYRVIRLKYTTEITVKRGTLSDEVILLMIPYLKSSNLDLILNTYNKNNKTVVKALLEAGAHFYLDKHLSSLNTNAEWHLSYNQTELRDARQIKYDQLELDQRYDHIKTMQFRLLLGLE